jgi:hypothetical protein
MLNRERTAIIVRKRNVAEFIVDLLNVMLSYPIGRCAWVGGVRERTVPGHGLVRCNESRRQHKVS